jgi:hypothetical protein
VGPPSDCPRRCRAPAPQVMEDPEEFWTNGGYRLFLGDDDEEDEGAAARGVHTAGLTRPCASQTSRRRRSPSSSRLLRCAQGGGAGLRRRDHGAQEEDEESDEYETASSEASDDEDEGARARTCAGENADVRRLQMRLSRRRRTTT